MIVIFSWFCIVIFRILKKIAAKLLSKWYQQNEKPLQRNDLSCVDTIPLPAGGCSCLHWSYTSFCCCLHWIASGSLRLRPLPQRWIGPYRRSVRWSPPTIWWWLPDPCGSCPVRNRLRCRNTILLCFYTFRQDNSLRINQYYTGNHAVIAYGDDS